jgi:hypothetical protein
VPFSSRVAARAALIEQFSWLQLHIRTISIP